VFLIGEDVLDAHANLTELDRGRLRWVTGLAGVEGGDLDRLLTSPGGVLRQVLWDASNRETLEAYTVRHLGQAAGAVFFGGSEAIMAEVRGGALVGCGLKFGPERRRCRAATDCEEGLRCLGVAPKEGDGRCVDSRADRQKERDMPCSSDGECGRDTGLVCGGLGLFGHGRCVPAWHRGVFAAQGGQIPDGDLDGLTVELPVSGLVGSLGDLRVSLSIEHARLRDLRVTLENADHGGAIGWTEIVLFAGERDGERLVMDRAPVSRLERDVPAVGRWRLRVQDLVTGSTGRLDAVRLELTTL
jgi:subtilisin-like proprotein convertase family protein